jgi:hypothetical protein
MLNLVNVDIFARFLEDAAKAAQRHRQEQSERSAKKRAERMNAQAREAWQAQQEELARQQARRLQEAVMRCVGTEIKVRLERLGVDPDGIATHAARFNGQGDLVRTWRGSAGRVLWGTVNPSGDIHLATRSDDAPNRFDAPPVMDEFGAFDDLDFDPLVRWLAGVAS